MDRHEKTPADFLITCVDHVITCDDTFQVFSPGAIAVHQGTIVAVGTPCELHQRYEAKETVTLSGHIVLPGLVNTHVHGAMSLFRGLADDLPLDRWLHEHIFPAESRHVQPDFVFLGTLLSCTEMLLGGTTCFCDGYFFEEAAAQAADLCGIRAVLGQGILDFPTPDAPDPKAVRHRIQAFLENFPRTSARLRPSLFCHAPYTCSPETLQWAKAVCTDRGMLFQIHVSETRWEVETIRSRYGTSPVAHLERLGILDDQTLCAHAVWIDDQEIHLLAETGACMAHCVESNLKLASGIAPIPAVLKAGIPVGLGTDGCASNNDLDLFSEMSLTARVHKAVTGNPTVCDARRVLLMATRMGAHAVGWGAATGSLEVGKKADMVALDMERAHLCPLYDPTSHVVYAARASDVRHVWVDGVPVVRDGVLKTVDVPNLLREVRKAAAVIAEGMFFR
ncbi:amidohydrolase family protein [Desulfosoma sp.]